MNAGVILKSIGQSEFQVQNMASPSGVGGSGGERVIEKLHRVHRDGGTAISLEFFPAKTAAGVNNLLNRIQRMGLRLQPTHVPAAASVHHVCDICMCDRMTHQHVTCDMYVVAG